jgi:hypothetical protein
VARFWPFLTLIFLGLLGLLLNKRVVCVCIFTRSHDLLTLGLEADCSDRRRRYREMASRALQYIVVPPITKHTATVIFLHVSICIQSAKSLP